MGSSGAEKLMLVHRFASGQVKYHGALFGVHITDARWPISHITIDCKGVVHGWNVMVYNNHQGRITYTKSIVEFAESVKGSMKVHSVLIRTMRDPEIYDHN